MRDDVVDIAVNAVAHPIVAGVMAELRGNLGVSDTGLPAFGISKVAHYAAQVGAALTLGLNPDECISDYIPTYIIDRKDQP